MAATGVDTEFERFYMRSFRHHVVIAMVVGMMLMMGTGILDWLFQPERAPRVWQSRLVFLLPLVVLTLISARGRLGRFQQPVVVLFTLLGVGALLEFARLSISPYHHYYNTGLVLMVMFCFVLMRLRFQWAAASSVLLFAVANAYWLTDERETLDLLVIKNFVLGIGCLASLMAAWTIEQTIRRQFQSQRELEHERDELMRLRQAERERAWLREHLDDFQLRISGDQRLESLFRVTMAFLGEALEPGFAAAYYVHGTELIGIAARSLSASQLPSLRIGEGLTGEAARQDGIMVVDAVPPDYPQIRSGTGGVTPRQLVLVPIRHQDTARGVLELALLTPVTDPQRQLLAAIRERLAQAIVVAEARHGRQFTSA